VIGKLRLQNFKGVREGEVELAPLTIILGGNNSGKTTVLEALFLAPNPFRRVPYATAGMFAAGALEALHRTLQSTGHGFLFYNYTAENASIQCDDYLLRFIKEDQHIYVTTNKNIGFSHRTGRGKEIQIIGTLSLSSPSATDLISHSYREAIIENSLLLSSKLAGMSYEYLKDNWPLITNVRISEKVAKDVSQLVHEKYVDMTIEPFFGGTLSINALLEDGRRVRLGDTGAGVQSYLIAKILYELEKPKVLLWDDIEAHFNPRMLSSVAGWFSDLVNENIQVIISTHSLEAARTIAAAEEKAQICLLSLEENVLKVKRLTLKEVDDMLDAGIDVRVAEPLLL